MASSVTVFDKDMGWNALLRSMEKAQSVAAYVGCDPAVIAEKATVYYPYLVEYGLGPGAKNVGERPFMRFTLDAHDNYANDLRLLAVRVLDRAKDGDTYLSLAASLRSLADAVAKDIQRTIVGLGAIDTGLMHNSMKCLRVVNESGGTTGGALHVTRGR